MSHNKNSMNSNGITKNKKPIDNKRGMKAWQDDEKQNEVKPNAGNVMQKKPEPIRSVGNNAMNPMQQQRIPYNEPKPPTYDYENKIIDEALEVSGISTKPTEGQLAEFIKRIRTLNKDVMWSLMSERLKKCSSEGNENDIKALTHILYVIERILKDNETGYNELIKQSAQLYLDLFNRNCNKKVNMLSSSIYALLTGQALMSKEDNQTHSIHPNTKPNTVIQNNNTANDAMELFTSSTPVTGTVASNHNEDGNKEASASSKFNFIKKKPTDPKPISAINETNNNGNELPMDLFNNIQSNPFPITTPTLIAPSTSSSNNEVKKPRLFNFINSKKPNESNSIDNYIKAGHNGTDLLSELGGLNFTQPQPVSLLNTNTSKNINDTSNNNTNEKKEIDIDYLAKCYNETYNNHPNNQYNPNQPIYNYNPNIPMQMPINPNQQQPPFNMPPNVVMYPFPQQMYNMPPNNMYGMPNPQYPYNPQYQPQYFPGGNIPQQYQDPLNHTPHQIPPEQNGKLPENKVRKENKPDPFGNLLDLMKNK